MHSSRLAKPFHKEKHGERRAPKSNIALHKMHNKCMMQKTLRIVGTKPDQTHKENAMINGILIRFGGLISLIFGGVHIFMGDVMDWQSQLAILSERNWAVVHLLNYATAYLLFTFAFLSFWHTRDLTHTPLGRSICVLMAVFWVLRGVGRVLLGGLLETQGFALPALYVIVFACYATALIRKENF